MNLRPVFVEEKTGHFQVWHPPAASVDYVVGADVAEGRVRDRNTVRSRPGTMNMSGRPDYSAAIVLEIETGEHVASWHGYVDPSEYGMILAAIGLYYNEAKIIPEVNGPGIAVVHKLVDDIRYPHVYEAKIWGRDSDDYLTGQFGWRTSVTTRPLLIARIHEILNSDRLFTKDRSLIDELRTMEFDEQGVPRARGKNKDDMVIALGLALQCRYEELYGDMSQGSGRKEKSDLRPEDAEIWRAVRAKLNIDGNNPPSGRAPSVRRFSRGFGARRFKR